MRKPRERLGRHLALALVREQLGSLLKRKKLTTLKTRSLSQV
jgi:hypothetical protein